MRMPHLGQADCHSKKMRTFTAYSLNLGTKEFCIFYIQPADAQGCSGYLLFTHTVCEYDRI